MTIKTHTPSPAEQRIVASLAHGMQLDLPIPFDAAYRAVSPAIRDLHPDQAPALPLFLKWLGWRQKNLTLRQAVHMWDNFLTAYVDELPRLPRAGRCVNAKVSATLLARLRLITDICLQKHYLAWERRMALTRTGRLALGLWRFAARGLVLAAAILVFSYWFERMAAAASLEATWFTG